MTITVRHSDVIRAFVRVAVARTIHLTSPAALGGPVEGDWTAKRHVGQLAAEQPLLERPSPLRRLAKRWGLAS